MIAALQLLDTRAEIGRVTDLDVPFVGANEVDSRNRPFELNQLAHQARALIAPTAH